MPLTAKLANKSFINFIRCRCLNLERFLSEPESSSLPGKFKAR